jgi:hypothetical protein
MIIENSALSKWRINSIFFSRDTGDFIVVEYYSLRPILLVANKDVSS